MTVPDDRPHRLEGLTLGPRSLTWKLFGDRRSALLILRTGTLQAMHPAIARALHGHPDVFVDPWNRLLRSAPAILEAVYGPDPFAANAQVGERNGRVRGVDPQDSQHHALEPETFFWAHATFFESQIATAEIFGDPLSQAKKQQLYGESLTWYGRYGLSFRDVPPDYASFQRYWAEVCEQVLEPTEVARVGLTEAERWPPPDGWIDVPLLRLLGRGSGAGLAWIARGTIGGELRARLGLDWSAEDECDLQRLARSVKVLWNVLPDELHMTPAADAAYEHEHDSARGREGHAVRTQPASETDRIADDAGALLARRHAGW